MNATRVAVGYGEYTLAVSATVITMTVLVGFNYFQHFFDKLHKTMHLYVVFDVETNGIEAVEAKMKDLRINYERTKEVRKEGDVRYDYELSGRSNNIEQLISYLISQKEKVKSFEY